MARQFLTQVLMVLMLVVGLAIAPFPADAASVDLYVTRYLKVSEPVPLPLDSQGQTGLFSAEDLSEGKRLFEENCQNCHVGGSTLPDPTLPLSLEVLAGAIPPRDNIAALVAYLRQPMTYDGQEETFWCRQVPESWMTQREVEHLSGFILRAAERAPGWGVSQF